MRKLSLVFAGALFGAARDLQMVNPRKGPIFWISSGRWIEPGARQGGALVVTAITFRLIRGGAHPLLDADFHLPQARDLDRQLIAARALFASAGARRLLPRSRLASLAYGSPPPWSSSWRCLRGWRSGSRLPTTRHRLPARPVVSLAVAGSRIDGSVGGRARRALDLGVRRRSAPSERAAAAPRGLRRRLVRCPRPAAEWTAVMCLPAFGASAAAHHHRFTTRSRPRRRIHVGCAARFCAARRGAALAVRFPWCFKWRHPSSPAETRRQRPKPRAARRLSHRRRWCRRWVAPPIPAHPAAATSVHVGTPVAPARRHRPACCTAAGACASGARSPWQRVGQPTLGAGSSQRSPRRSPRAPEPPIQRPAASNPGRASHSDPSYHRRLLEFSQLRSPLPIAAQSPNGQEQNPSAKRNARLNHERGRAQRGFRRAGAKRYAVESRPSARETVVKARADDFAKLENGVNRRCG